VPPNRPKARSLSIFLLKESVLTSDDALLDPASLEKSDVNLGGDRVGKLFVKATVDRTPSWLSFFQGALNPAPPVLRNASAAAVLFASGAGRLFAVTFGYGRNLLRPGTWEEDFGLKVTLNTVDPSRIRSLDKFKFDAISQHSQIQASRDANIVEFGLDVEEDLLRAVTGKPRSPNPLANQLTGKDSLKADVQIALHQLPALLEKLWEKFNDVSYKEHFSWVDNVNDIRDPTLTKQLDGTLIEKLRSREFDRLWLAIPDRVDWAGMAGFKYSDTHKAQVHSDVHFQTFLEEAGEHFVPTAEALKSRKRIYLISHENDSVAATWSAYRCVYCEIDSAEILSF
jgi:uncharacterized protein (TIGR04141 family)